MLSIYLLAATFFVIVWSPDVTDYSALILHIQKSFESFEAFSWHSSYDKACFPSPPLSLYFLFHYLHANFKYRQCLIFLLESAAFCPWGWFCHLSDKRVSAWVVGVSVLEWVCQLMMGSVSYRDATHHSKSSVPEPRLWPSGSWPFRLQHCQTFCFFDVFYGKGEGVTKKCILENTSFHFISCIAY